MFVDMLACMHGGLALITDSSLITLSCGRTAPAWSPHMHACMHGDLAHTTESSKLRSNSTSRGLAREADRPEPPSANRLLRSFRCSRMRASSIWATC